MRCSELAVALGLPLGVSALRTGTSGTTTTKFVITWHTDDWDSNVECVAREDIRHWWLGKPHDVRKGDTLVTIPTNGALDSWELELEDQGRHVPQFECQMVNVMGKVECTATSAWVNTKLRQKYGETIPFATSPLCRVVIENETPIETPKNFYIRAFTTWDSTHMQCIAAADILLSEGEIHQGDDLFPESTRVLGLTPHQSPDDYELTTEIKIEIFNPKIHGFFCKVIRNGVELCKAESWNAKSGKNIVAELGGCQIQITDDIDIYWPVYYPRDWGRRKFQITALSDRDSPSTMTCWSDVDLETKERGSVTAGTSLIHETMQKSKELNKVVTIIHRQKYDIAQESLRCQIAVAEIDEEGNEFQSQLCTVNNWEKLTDKTSECEMHIALLPPAAE